MHCGFALSSVMQAKQLEKKEAEVKLLEAFYKERLAQLPKKVRQCPSAEISSALGDSVFMQRPL